MFKLTKNKIKKVVAILLSFVMIICSTPIITNAAEITKENSKEITVSKWVAYGHEIHKGKNANGDVFPLFCIEYGTTSPSSSYAYGTRKMMSEKAQLAAKWIYAGYMSEHGNSINDLDMAYCQKKVWAIMGSSTSWTFSDDGYNAWCKKAEDKMNSLNVKPSFDGSNIGTIKAGESKIVSDSNQVLSDYPAFDYSTCNGNVHIVHSKNKNEITITVDKTCTNTSFKLPVNSYYKNGTGDDEDAILYYPYGSANYQKLIYSNYYDPISFALEGNVQPVGNLKLKKTSEDDKVSGISFSVSGPNGYSKTVKTDTNGEGEIEGLVQGKYTVTENTPDKYVAPKSQTVTVQGGNKTTTVTFSNILKKFKVSVNKQDIEKTHPQGDAKLGGAIYGLYHGDTLVAQYTTQNDGTFDTDYFVCDTNWTLREIQPSEGYLLDETVYQVGADPQLYTVEYNWTSNTVKEQVKKGKVSIIKHTDDGSTKIETPEKGAEFQLYLKSSGSFVNADPDERDTIICDEDGFASSKLLPYGVYTVHQTKGWDGREKITDFDVFIQSDNVTYKFLINNANFSSYLKVVKLDKETDKQIPYAGAAFEIYDADGHRISMKYTYPQVTTIHTFYTNSEGYLITPEKLEYGDYTLVEVQAPYGYVLDSTPIAFSINQESSSTDTGVTVVKVKAKDIAQKGIIEITKTGEVFSSVNSSTNEKLNLNIYMPVYENGNLKNAVYEIYAAEDIITTDGTVRAEKGELVDTITTGDKGIAKSKELYLGKYTIIEKTAPLKFVLNKDKHNVELTYAGQNVKVTSTALSVYNERQKVSVSLNKAIEQDEAYGIGNNKEVTSVQFGIFADEDVKATDGTIIQKDSLVTFANCDENGKITFDCDLPIGFKWYVKEIATDEHYILSDKHYEFSTEYAGQNTKIIEININEGKSIDNELKRGRVKGIKTDKDNAPLENAIIGIFKVGTTEFTEQTAIITVKTDKDGVFVFEDVPYGEWIVKEVQAPDKYVVDSTQHHIYITDDGVTINVSMVDKQVVISKIDITTGDELEGAELVIKDKDGNVVDSWTSTNEVHYVNGLAEGQTYILTEKTAPYGYEIANSIEFKVTEDKNIQTIVMEDAPILSTIMVNKVDSTTGENIISKKFEFTLYSDAECKNKIITVAANTDNGTALFSDLRFGTYYIKESKAPKGYMLSDEVVKIEINENGVFANGEKITEENDVYSIVYQNSLLPSVFTGDSKSALMYLTMAAIAVIFIAIMIIIKKKYKG